MKSMFNLGAAWLSFVFVATVGSAQAAMPLQGRDINGQAVEAQSPAAVFQYDPNLDVTWFLRGDAFGPMYWSQAMTWASELQLGTFGDWVLPTALNQNGSGPCMGLNCVDSQLGYLMNVGRYSDPVAYALTLQTSPLPNFYWTSTPHEFLTDFAYGMGRNTGEQFRFQGLGTVIAVRAGDVASSVPEPYTASLVFAGLAVAAMVLRHQPR